MAAIRSFKNESSLPEEKRLWESFKKGDIGAYEQLFNRYYHDLYRYGLNLTPRKELVRDSIHSLFVTLWDQKENIGEMRSPKAYLLASLRRKIMKSIHQEKSRDALYSAHLFSENVVEISVEESIIRNELAEGRKKALETALDLLPLRQKEVLFLKYYNGMSYEEIEEILAINNQSIRNHIYRAIQKLRTHLVEKKSIPGLYLALIPFLLSLMISFHDLSAAFQIG